MPTVEPYRLNDLMVRFGYRDVDAFRKRRAHLEALGFPPPLPGCTRPLKWSREAVDEWFKAGGRFAQKVTAPEGAPIDELAQARARLKQKLIANG